MVNGRLAASNKLRFTAHDLGLRVIIVIKGLDTILSLVHLEEIYSACHTPFRSSSVLVFRPRDRMHHQLSAEI